MRSLVAWAVGLAICAPPSVGHAAFPGGDGVIVFSYESPVPGEGLTQSDLYTIAPDGTGLARLTASPHRNELGAAWNADGTRIAFWRTPAPFGHGSIWVMDADGSSRVKLTSGIDARDPAWSPNGRRIAFTRFGGRHLNPDIVTMRASDGGGMRSITSWPSLEFEPAWSPDGTQISFTRAHAQGDVGDVWVVDVATRDARSVTGGKAYDTHSTWAPDGSQIAFARITGNLARIAVVGSGGSGATVLTSGAFDSDPAFAPTGTSIVFGSDRVGGFLPDLWLMDPDGSDVRILADLTYASFMPDWRPTA